MNKHLTELVFILDRSGSMADMADDTLGGFNSMLESQKNEPGRALVSCVLFNQSSTVLYDRVDIRRIHPMTHRDYCPAGMTALLDAVGGAIHHIGNVHKYAREEDRPAHTLFVITTDGMENASRFYSADEVRRMIEHEKEKYNWEFLFLGANIDAVTVASRYGIDSSHAVRYRNDSEGVRLHYDGVNAAIKSIRADERLDEDWKNMIEEDMEERR